jgi:mono/diheme cytochrome c family protein
MKRLMVSAVWAAALVASGVPGPRVAASQQAPAVLTESLAGRDSFELYCAPCHGREGKGDGPVASALRARPTDLTEMARRNDGAFPREGAREFIVGSGRALPAHGTTEMPVWGPMFRAFESDTRARIRIDNLVQYLESIQAPSTGSLDTGAQLFRTYCASCHGTDARGSGPLAEHLRRTPPDLTLYAMRNGGGVPTERLIEIIDGRHVPSHGDREMPVWGDAFRFTPGGTSQAAVKARIDAIVRYLAGIQRRLAAAPSLRPDAPTN